MTGDTAVGLCILIAQQRECVVYTESSRLPLKLVGEMVDQVSGGVLRRVKSLFFFSVFSAKNEKFSVAIHFYNWEHSFYRTFDKTTTLNGSLLHTALFLTITSVLMRLCTSPDQRTSRKYVFYFGLLTKVKCAVLLW